MPPEGSCPSVSRTCSVTSAIDTTAPARGARLMHVINRPRCPGATAPAVARRIPGPRPRWALWRIRPPKSGAADIMTSTHVPHAFRAAQHAVIAVVRADVMARVRAGDVVLR